MAGISNDSGPRQSEARLKLERLIATSDEDDATAQIAGAFLTCLDIAQTQMDRAVDSCGAMIQAHHATVLAAMKEIAGEYSATFERHAAADRIRSLQDSMGVIGDEFKRLNDRHTDAIARLAIAETRIDMLEGRFETRQ
jgi:hypothetical protein